MAMMAGDVLEKSLQQFELLDLNGTRIMDTRFFFNEYVFLFFFCVGGVPKLTGVGVYPSNSMKREWMEYFPMQNVESEHIQFPPISG